MAADLSQLIQAVVAFPSAYPGPRMIDPGLPGGTAINSDVVSGSLALSSGPRADLLP
jgi:hypothetical protein